MSMWSLRHPDGPPLGQTFGSRLDAADDARKDVDDPARTLPCPACHRPSRMMRVAGCCPFEDCRHGSGS